MAEEQTPGGVQDPVQPQAPPAAPAAPVQYQSNAPWAGDLSQFGEHAAAVDQYLRERWQPRVTQLEQQYAQTEDARQFAGMFEQDPVAANVAVNRQMYGDEYGDQLAASLGRPDLLVGTSMQPQQQAAPQQQAQPANLPPEYQEMYQDWADRRAQEQYNAAKMDFLSTTDQAGNRLYADINPELLDPFAAGAETWEEAVNSYRAYAAQFAQAAPEIPPAPTTIGSQAGGTVGSTPAVPDYSQMRDPVGAAIDDIFSEAKPVAPPVIGGQ